MHADVNQRRLFPLQAGQKKVYRKYFADIFMGFKLNSVCTKKLFEAPYIDRVCL